MVSVQRWETGCGDRLWSIGPCGLEGFPYAVGSRAFMHSGADMRSCTFCTRYCAVLMCTCPACCTAVPLLAVLTFLGTAVLLLAVVMFLGTAVPLLAVLMSTDVE